MKLRLFISFALTATCASIYATGYAASSDIKMTSLELQQMFPCKSSDGDTMKPFLSGDMPEMTAEDCGCVYKAMVVDVDKPEFQVEQRNVMHGLGLESSDLEEPLWQTFLIIAPLQSMESDINIENSKRRNAGSTPLLPSLKDVCGFSYNDLGDLRPN